MPEPQIPRDARETYFDEHGRPIAYCPKESIGITDIVRIDFFRVQDLPRLRALLTRAREKTRQTGERFLVVCIDVEDEVWRPLVDSLMPGHDWSVYRARGERPVARGVVPRDFVAKLVGEIYPAAGEVPIEPCLCVFAGGGVLVLPGDAV